IEYVVADLSEPKQIKQAASQITAKYPAIDAVVNVAAIYSKARKENSQGHEFMFATNHLGPFTLSNALLPALKASGDGRIVTVSAPSTTKVNFDDIHGKNKFSPGFMGAFGASKMMNLMFTYSMADKLKGSNVKATVLHPGLVKSELTKDMPAFLRFIFNGISGKPDKAAAMLSKLATDAAYANANGIFFKASGKEIKSSKYSYDKTMQEKLWKLSEELTS
ncbi:MAG TPA: SDR family NAD(P)-dependent oxidoreductase, partial [Flavobacteriales bacterium]|nr:SDR family NAD(P)-dependent oxidoreductase [Flavobacteriales bacterium]